MRFITCVGGGKIQRSQQPRESSCMVRVSRGEQFEPLSRERG
jgi:hypothetical protein